MPQKRELSKEQIAEIMGLKGVLPADQVKKRYAIGSSRLYSIWRSAEMEKKIGTVDSDRKLAVIEAKVDECNRLLGVIYYRLSELAEDEDEVDSNVEEELEAMLNATKQQNTRLKHVHGTLEQMQNWSYLVPIGFLIWQLVARTVKVARRINATLSPKDGDNDGRIGIEPVDASCSGDYNSSERMTVRQMWSVFGRTK